MRVAVGEVIPAASASWRLVHGPSASGSSTWNCASEMPSAGVWLAARPRARLVARKNSASASLSDAVAAESAAVPCGIAQKLARHRLGTYVQPDGGGAAG